MWKVLKGHKFTVSLFCLSGLCHNGKWHFMKKKFGMYNVIFYFDCIMILGKWIAQGVQYIPWVLKTGCNRSWRVFKIVSCWTVGTLFYKVVRMLNKWDGLFTELAASTKKTMVYQRSHVYSAYLSGSQFPIILC